MFENIQLGCGPNPKHPDEITRELSRIKREVQKFIDVGDEERGVTIATDRRLFFVEGSIVISCTHHRTSPAFISTYG